MVIIGLILTVAGSGSAQMLGNPLSYPYRQKVALGVSAGYETAQNDQLTTTNKLLLIRGNVQPLSGLFVVGSAGKISSSLEWTKYGLPTFQVEPGLFGSAGIQFHLGFGEEVPFKLVAAVEERYYLLKQPEVSLAEGTIMLAQTRLEQQEIRGSLISVFQLNQWGVYFGLQELFQDFDLHGFIQPEVGSSQYASEHWGSENQTGVVFGISMPMSATLSLGFEYTNASDLGTAFHLGINQFGLLK